MAVNTVKQREVLEQLAKYLNDRLPGVLIFQGGLFIGFYTGSYRRTQDVDASIFEAAVYEYVKQALVKFGEKLKAMGYIEKYEVDPEVSIGRSGGAKYYDLDGSKLASVDINLHSRVLSYNVVNIKGYGTITVSSLEQVMADKMSAMYSSKRFRRAKDLYDIYCLRKTCWQFWNPAESLKLIEKDGRLAEIQGETPFDEESLKKMEHAYMKLYVQDKAGLTMEKPPFRDVLTAFGDAARALGWL